MQVRSLLASLATVTVFAIPAAAQNSDPFADVPRADVMLLGTFHFDDLGLDDYRPQFPWDPMTPVHQREIENVVTRLAAFAPTRIAVEWPVARQPELDSLYAAYLDGRLTLGPNEVQQIGFRLGKRLGHALLYAVDVQGRAYEPGMTDAEYNARVARLMEGADAALVARQQRMEMRYTVLHRTADSLKTTMPLAEYLAGENTRDEIMRGHGQYLIGGFRIGRDGDYLGPDMRTRWYNRNLRIFHNLQRIAHPDDRVLLIIGAGHLPVLHHAVDASPEFRLVDVVPYLRR
jgi:hypothetical protein